MTKYEKSLAKLKNKDGKDKFSNLLSSLTLPCLRVALKLKGKSDYGKKEDLINRIKDCYTGGILQFGRALQANKVTDKNLRILFLFYFFTPWFRLCFNILSLTDATDKSVVPLEFHQFNEISSVSFVPVHSINEKMMHVVDFEEILLSDTLLRYTVTLNPKKYIKRYSVWIALYLSILLIILSLVTICLMNNLTFGSILFVLFIASIVYLINDVILEESITIIRQFGIQLSHRTMLGTEKTKFIDKDRLEAVFIHEYFYGSQVRYSVAFIIRDEDRLTLLFKFLNPGFLNIKRVYQECLKEQ